MILVDMKMPKTCEHCHIQDCMFYKREWQTISGDKTWRNARAEGCLIKGEILDKQLKWEKVGEYFRCPSCKTEFKEMSTVMGKPLYKFCPECGGRMEIDFG